MLEWIAKIQRKDMDGIKKKKSASRFWKKKVMESKLNFLTIKSPKEFRSNSITNPEMSPKKNVQLQKYNTFSDINDLSVQHVEDDFKVNPKVSDVNDSECDDSMHELFKTLADKVEQKCMKKQDKITDLKKKMIDLLDQVSTLEEQKSLLDKNSANLSHNYDLLKLAMDEVEKKYKEVKNINKTLENNLTHYQDHIAQIEDSRKYLETNLKECKSRENELKMKLDETIRDQMESKKIIQKQESIISRLEEKTLCNCSFPNDNISDESSDLQTKLRKTNKERLVFFNEKENLKRVNESLRSEIVLLKKGHHEVSNYAFEHETPKVSIKTEIKIEPVDDDWF